MASSPKFSLQDDGYVQFEEKFLQAIGDSGKFKNIDLERKKAFAGYVFEEMNYLLMTGTDKRNIPNKQKKLLTKAREAESSLKQLLAYQKAARSEFKSITHLVSFMVDDAPKSPLKEAMKYLDAYCEALERLHSPIKRGPSDVISVFVASSLAQHYKDYLGLAPATSRPIKGNKQDSYSIIKPTPFDRICKLVESYWGISLASSAKTKVIRGLK